MTGFTQIVTSLGGHVVGLRGDGLYAVFGPTNLPEVAVDFAALAAGAALDQVKDELNPLLDKAGIVPVIAHAGADFGEVVFVRSGVSSSNEVNVVGFTANFASKCEKLAAAWEFVVGEGFADVIADKSMLGSHEQPPKTYTERGISRRYGFYKYHWQRVASDYDSVVADMRGRALEEIGAA